MMMYYCIKCGEKLIFNFGKCNYQCPKCNKVYGEYEIKRLYGESKY